MPRIKPAKFAHIVYRTRRFQVDAYASNAAATAFMAGPGYAENPIGVEFDPDDWLARLRAGAPESDFLERHVHQPVAPLRGRLFECREEFQWN